MSMTPRDVLLKAAEYLEQHPRCNIVDALSDVCLDFDTRAEAYRLAKSVSPYPERGLWVWQYRDGLKAVVKGLRAAAEAAGQE